MDLLRSDHTTYDILHGYQAVVAHLDVRPAIAQRYRARVDIDIGEGVIDMGKVLMRDLLRWELSSVDTPAESAHCAPTLSLDDLPIDLTEVSFGATAKYLMTHKVSYCTLAYHLLFHDAR